MASKIWEYKIPQSEIKPQQLYADASLELEKAIALLAEQSFFIIQVLPMCTYETEGRISGTVGKIHVVIKALIIYK